MFRLLMYITGFALSLPCFAQQLNIGVMRGYSVSALELTYVDGNYIFYGDTTEITTLWKGQVINLQRSGNKIKFTKDNKNFGSFDSIYIKEKTENTTLRLQCVAPSTKKSRRYMNNFSVVTEGTNALKLINHVEMANYLGGVIESEGGGGKHIEYYKVQAILSRTYALGHLTKHKKEGFQLCDQVHCQAYHDKLIYTPDIAIAVEDSKGIVMLNQDLQLAQGFFFANCGGQTSEADFVWNNAVDHCKSVVDTFCIHSRQATWTKKVEAHKWENFLVEQYGYPIHDSIWGPVTFSFEQLNRKAFYHLPQMGIPLRDLRKEFNLKSTWFTCYREGNYVIINGKGFGHGVGVCQEGAMGMSKNNFSSAQILNFYFSGIHLMDYYDWLFINQKSQDQNFNHQN
jgi:stage II sporulation protein D